MAVTHDTHPQLLQAVMDINFNQRKHAVDKLEQALGGVSGKIIGVLGLSFKPNTDDTRYSPSLDIIKMLIAKGATVQAYDPQAMEASKAEVPELNLCKNPYEVAEGVDALLLATEWNEFKFLDFERVKASMRGKIILDGRNIWDAKELRDMGFTYDGMGLPGSL
jgi:UDPglucose 6-dehydrogenase